MRDKDIEFADELAASDLRTTCPAMTANVVKAVDLRRLYPGQRSNFRRRLPE